MSPRHAGRDGQESAGADRLEDLDVPASAFRTFDKALLAEHGFLAV
jgi:hypothetical protein